MSFVFWMSIGFVLGIVVASFFEWTLHRFFMHRPVGNFRYPFGRRTLIHHLILRADHSYHLIDEEDKHTIPMAWWNGPVLVACCQVPFLIAAIWFQKWSPLCGAAISCTLY